MAGYSFAIEKKEHCVGFLANPNLKDVHFEEEFRYVSKKLELEELRKSGKIVVSNKFRYHVKRFHELPFELLEKEKKERFYDISKFRHKLVHNYKYKTNFVDKKPKKQKFFVNVPFNYKPRSVEFKVNRFRWAYMTEYMHSNEFLKVIENKYLKSIQFVADWNMKLKFFNSSHMTNLLHNRLMKYRVNVIMNRPSIRSGKKTVIEMLQNRAKKHITIARIKHFDDKYKSIFVTPQCSVGKISEDRIVEFEALTRRLLPKKLLEPRIPLSDRIEAFGKEFEDYRRKRYKTFGFCNGIFSQAYVEVSHEIRFTIAGLEMRITQDDEIQYANGIVIPNKFFIYLDKEFLYRFKLKILPTAYAFHLGVLEHFGEMHNTDLFLTDSSLVFPAVGDVIPYSRLNAERRCSTALFLSRSLYEHYTFISDEHTISNIMAILNKFGCKLDGEYDPVIYNDDPEYYYNFRGFNMEYGKSHNFIDMYYFNPLTQSTVDNFNHLIHFHREMVDFEMLYCYATEDYEVEEADDCELQMFQDEQPQPGAQIVYDEDVPPMHYYDPVGAQAAAAAHAAAIQHQQQEPEIIPVAQQVIHEDDPPDQPQGENENALADIVDHPEFTGPLPIAMEPGDAPDVQGAPHFLNMFYRRADNDNIPLMNYMTNMIGYRERISVYPHIWFYRRDGNLNYFASNEHHSALSLKDKWTMFKTTWFGQPRPVSQMGINEMNVGRRILNQYEDVHPLPLQPYQLIIAFYVTYMYTQVLVLFCELKYVFVRAHPFLWYMFWSFIEEFSVQYLGAFRLLTALLERTTPIVMLGKFLIALFLMRFEIPFLQAFGLHYIYNLIAHFTGMPTFCLGDYPVGQSKQIVHTIIDASAIARYVIPSLRTNFNIGNYRGMIMDILYVLHSFFRNCIEINLSSLQNIVFTQILSTMKDGLYNLLSSTPSKFYRTATGFVVYMYDKFGRPFGSYFTETQPLLIDELPEEEELAFQQAGFDILKMYADLFSVQINALQNSAFMNKLYMVFSSNTIIPVLRVLGLNEYIPTVFSYFEKITAISSITQISGLIFEFFSSFLPDLISGDIASHKNVITDWFTRAELLIKYGSSVSMLAQYGITEGIPDEQQKPAAMRMSQYMDEISKMTAEGAVLFKNTPKDSLYHGRMGQMIASLQISALTASRLLQSMRIKMRPFVIHTFGPAGIGKTTMFNAVMHKVAPIYEIDPGDVWQMNSSNFADGYVRQKTIFVDDFNQISFPEVASAANQMFLNITGNYPVLANMANVEDKGKVLLNPSVVYVTSNDEFANTQGIFHNSVAITRRLQYAINVTWGNYQDRICAKFRCYERVVRNNGPQSKIEHDHVLETFDSHQMLAWIEERAQAHLTAEMDNLRRMSNFANIPQFRFMGAMRHMYVPVPAFIANPFLNLLGIERESEDTFYTRILNTVISPLIQHGSSALFRPLFESYSLLCMIAWSIYESDVYLPRNRIEICQEVFVRFFCLIICDYAPYGWLIHSIYNIAIYLLIGPTNIARAEMVADRTQRFLGWKANFSIYLIALAGFAAIYWNSNPVEQQTYGDRPSEEDLEEAKKVSERLGEVAVSSVTAHPTTRAVITDRPYYAPTGSAGRIERILANVVTLVASDCESLNRQTGTGTIFGNGIYTAHHVVNFKKFMLQFTHNNTPYSFIIDSSMVIVDDKDQCFVIIKEVIKNSLSWDFINTAEYMQADSYRYSHSAEKFDIKKATMIRPSLINTQLYQQYTYDFEAVLEKPTEAGMSGMPLILMTKRNVFVCGIHTLLINGTTVGGVLVTAKFLKNVAEVRSLRGGGNLITQTSTVSYDGIAEVKLQALHNKSILNYFTPETSRDVVPLGFFGFKPKRQKTRIKESKYFVHIMDKLKKYCLPDFSSRVVGEKWIDPYLTNLAEVGNCVKLTNIPVVRSIQDYIARRLYETAKFPLQRNYTYAEAVNGIPGIIKSLELNAAAGPGFPGNKGQYVKGYFPNAVPTEKISKTVNAYLDMLDQGICPLFVFKASLKDEIITKKKFEEGRIRMFCGSALPMVILYRMAFGNIYAWMQNNRLVHPWKVGINCTSPEWDYIGNRLNRFKRKYMSDIRFFDKDNGIIDTAIEIAVEIERLYGMDPLWIKRCSLLVIGFRHYVLEIEGALAELDSSVPSGGSGTVDFNCFTELFCEVTSMYLAFINVFKKPNTTQSVELCFKEYDFFDNTELFVYGDDNLKSMSENLDWYTDQHIYDGFQNLGFTLTKADKTEGIPESFEDIEKAEFLKRRFRFDEELQQYVAPLDESSLWKMIGYFEDKGNISEKTFITIVTNEAFRQWWLHGRLKFNEWRDFYKSLPKDISYNPCPTYDELTIEYLDQGVKPFITWAA